jgi:Response regulator containing CheY-like receiver domain and AraC-type DNA-binding domain
MFKVLIIDDEPIIRKGIRNIVNWDNFGCEVCGEAGDGLEGSELIKEMRPDVLITDIRMPEVDGLSMIANIKECVPDCKIIILTGYRDFDYAQEALKLGAFDYILKPTKIEELNSVIARAVKELRFKYDRQSEMEKIRRTYEKNLPFIKEKLLYNMLYGTFDEGILSQNEALGIVIDRFMLGIVEIDDAARIKEKQSGAQDGVQDGAARVADSQLYQFGMVSTVEEIFSELFSVHCVSISSQRVAFVLVLGENAEIRQDEINAKCTYLQNIIQNCFGFTVSVALSTVGNGCAMLPEKLRECLDALEHKFYLGTNCVIFYKDLNSFFKYADYSTLTDKQKQLVDSVKAGNPDAVEVGFRELTETVNSLGSSDKEYVKNFYFNTISLINSIRVSLSASDKMASEVTLANLYKLIEKCDNLSDLNVVLEDAAKQTVAKVNEFNNNNMKLLMRKAVDYLEKHYAEPITLNQAAETLYVSNFYLSRMFKKELGINFVDFLNELRIEKAKALLTDARYKTYEVAEAVGVPNSHYFSKLFRKHVGMTASEYRESAIQGAALEKKAD